MELFNVDIQEEEVLIYLVRSIKGLTARPRIDLPSHVAPRSIKNPTAGIRISVDSSRLIFIFFRIGQLFSYEKPFQHEPIE
jgi:hypothetical protein